MNWPNTTQFISTRNKSIKNITNMYYSFEKNISLIRMHLTFNFTTRLLCIIAYHRAFLCHSRILLYCYLLRIYISAYIFSVLYRVCIFSYIDNIEKKFKNIVVHAVYIQLSVFSSCPIHVDYSNAETTKLMTRENPFRCLRDESLIRSGRRARIQSLKTSSAGGRPTTALWRYA